MTNKQSWEPFFPEAQVRDAQADILNFITENWDDAESFQIEGPPGIGKSAISMTLAGWSAARGENTFITTTTVQLEDQYMRSYGGQGLRQLHSAKHYHCLRGGTYNCKQGQALCGSTKSYCWDIDQYGTDERCPYKLAKEAFIYHPYGILNAAYLLTENYYVGALEPRAVLIADEGHTLGDAICSFLEYRLTVRNATRLQITFPQLPDDPLLEMTKLLDWLRTQYQPALEVRLRMLRDEMRVQVKNGGASPETILAYTEDIEHCQMDLKRLRIVLLTISPTTYVVEHGPDFYALIPISAKPFAAKILKGIASKVILLSATLVDFDYHCQELGLDRQRCGTYQAQSPFPVENRLIYTVPAVHLDWQNLAESAREAADVIEFILARHENQRGIIFVSSYEQAKLIRDEVNKKIGVARLHTHEGSGGKKITLLKHSGQSDSVIVSPSMHEGVDLKGDLSEFQIVVKLPFPSLGSKLVKRRKQLSPAWYSYTTALKLIQATGRSIRTETDVAPSYILDSKFTYFYDRNRGLFPDWWQQAVTSSDVLLSLS